MCTGVIQYNIHLAVVSMINGVEGVLNMVWNVDDTVNLDFDSTSLPGHTKLS